MVKLLREKKGDLKLAAKGIVALIAILLIVKFYSPATAAANVVFETANKFTDDIGLNDLISIPKIDSNTLDLDAKGALVASFKLNGDGEKLVTEGGDIRVIFSSRPRPEDGLRDVCTAFRVSAGLGGSSQDDANRMKGFDCEVPIGSTTTAFLNSWVSGGKKPIPVAEYRATVFVKGKDDQNFEEGKDSPFFKFYTTEYVELFRTGLKDCGSDCDVVEKKVVALLDGKLGMSKKRGSSETYTLLAYVKNMDREFRDVCASFLFIRKEKDNILKACLRSELQELYTDVITEFANDNIGLLKGKQASDLLKVDCITEKDGLLKEGKLDSVKKVCEAKRDLMKSLNELGWVDKTG